MEKENTCELAERRVDPELREKYSELTAQPDYENMSREELLVALMTSEKTGIPNGRAWNRMRREYTGDLMAMVDADSLKWVNDTYGHQAGDAMLRAIAEGLRACGLTGVYHLGGDEFAVDLSSALEIWKLGELASMRVAMQSFSWVDENGEQFVARGAQITYGVGDQEGTAEGMLGRMKRRREGLGLRGERGHPAVGLVVQKRTRQVN